MKNMLLIFKVDPINLQNVNDKKLRKLYLTNDKNKFSKKFEKVKKKKKVLL